MSFYKGDIENQTLKNKYYRKVIYTTKNMQLVLMSIPKGEEIGMEKHKNTSQFIRVEGGKGIAIVGNKKYSLKDGKAVLIPPNKRHNIINTGSKPLKLYSIYSPPEHPSDRKEMNKIE
jgi:mannose-6-phosphate isomerase-like protein (cupin superfamily)